jgi:hypothetical protein
MLISNLPEPYKTMAEFFRSRASILPTSKQYIRLDSFDWLRCTGQDNVHHHKFWKDLASGQIPNYIPIGIFSYYENKSGKRLDYVPGSGAARVSIESLPNLDDFIFDQEASSENMIVFVKKPVEPVLPKSWEELDHVSGVYVDSESRTHTLHGPIKEQNKNVFATPEQADASIALAQLSQLRKVYRQGWEPNWSSNEVKWCIYFSDKELITGSLFSVRYFLSFQSKEVAVLFLKNFEDLIKKALPLMS